MEIDEDVAVCGIFTDDDLFDSVRSTADIDDITDTRFSKDIYQTL